MELSTSKLDKRQSFENKWDNAINDAETQIETLTKRVRSLKTALLVFKANKRDGVPWPGENEKGPQEGGQ